MNKLSIKTGDFESMVRKIRPEVGFEPSTPGFNNPEVVIQIPLHSKQLQYTHPFIYVENVSKIR